MLRGNRIALGTVPARVFVWSVVHVAYRTFSLATVHHQDLLHFPVVEVVEVTYRRLGTLYQIDEDVWGAHSRHELVGEEFRGRRTTRRGFLERTLEFVLVS